MTGMAWNITMLTFQVKFRVPVMFKSGFIPLLFDMAILTFFTKSTLVYVSNCMTGNTGFWCLFIPVAYMA